MSPDSDDALSPENSSTKKRNNSSLKKLYHNFDTFALNCKMNGGEKEFKIDRIIRAMPNPKPQWDKPKLENITYKNCYFPSSQKTYQKYQEIQKIHKKKDKTNFDQDPFYHGQPRAAA